jgi:uncharacterized membrane protein
VEKFVEVLFWIAVGVWVLVGIVLIPAYALTWAHGKWGGIFDLGGSDY